MVTKATKDTPQRAHRRKSNRAAHAAAAPHRKRAARSRSAETLGTLIGVGALCFVGALVVAGAGSLAALLLGFEPPGYEKEARRLRKYTLDHSPDFSRILNANALLPIKRTESWLQDKVRSATGL